MAALIILFPASFRYEFNAMDAIDGQQTELESALHNMLLIVFFLLVLWAQLMVAFRGESQMWPSSAELLYLSLWRLLPDWSLSLLQRVSTRGTRRLARFRATAEKAAREVFQKQVSVLANGDHPSEKNIIDILGVLRRSTLYIITHTILVAFEALSHLTEDPKRKMTEEEIYAQFA